MSDRVKAVRPDEWIAISVFALTVVASTYTWFGLAQSAHFPNLIAWVPSISIDLGGLYFAHNWIAGRTNRIRFWGEATTIMAFGVSLGGNAVQHAIEARFLVINVWIVLAVGAVPALALFAVVHQWALTAVTVRAPRPARPGAAPTVVLGSKGTPTPPQSTVPVAAPSGKGGKRAEALRWTRDNWPVRAGEIRLHMAAHGEISMTEATRVRDKVAAERQEATA
jgi:hypothetical protein